MSKQTEINTVARQIEESDGKVNTLRPDQTRIAGMMEKLDRTTDTYQNLLKKLNRQEGEIDTLTTNRAKLAEQVEALRRQYAEMLNGLTID
jgi:septal ring factor EnvC (AmiA/AmiB activator)